MQGHDAKATKVPRLFPTADGAMSLVLEEDVTFDSFAAAATKWAKELGLQLNITERIDGLDEQLWSCEKDGAAYWLATDVWFSHLSLEPRNDAAAAGIFRIGASLDLAGGSG